ncbi:helix-hairpin-helix domain-containing protein [Halorientalis halophila]|uniref:helix-hairpin-helix domain-containing protein n=1 Tax=Halorientalis halophila TaxID=3108499 RepID=UPI003009B467
MTAEEFERLDGVGSVRARQLAEAGFESLAQLVRADLGDLTAIDGIGDATATDIVASATALLDESDPAIRPTTSLLKTHRDAVFDVYTPVLAEPYRIDATVADRPSPSETDATPEQRAETDPRPDRPERATGGDGSAAAAASRLLAAEADADGRIGREPLRASDFDVDVRLGVAPADAFEKRGTTALAAAGFASEDAERIVRAGAAVERWLADDADRGRRLLTDRAGAVEAALAREDASVEPASVLDAVDPEPARTGLSSVGLRSLTVRPAKGVR